LRYLKKYHLIRSIFYIKFKEFVNLFSYLKEAQLIELYNQYSDRTDKWKIIAAKLNRTHQSVRGQ
jgi:hypothetical protein